MVIGIVGFGGSDYKFEGCVCFGIISKMGMCIEIVEFGVIGCENVCNVICDYVFILVFDCLSYYLI